MECITLIKQPPIELNVRQRKAILHLLSARTVKQASREAGVRLGTLYKWMKLPHFVAELERLRSEAVSDTVSRLKVYSLDAVTVLAELMNTSGSESIKRGCAGDILENCRSFIQLKDLETRLAALEEAVTNSTETKGGVHVYQRRN